MSLFGAIVRTAVNTVALPIAVVKDVVLLPVRAADLDDEMKSTKEAVQRLKDEAEVDQ